MKCFLVFSGGIKWEFLLIFIFIIDYQIKWDLINPFLPNVSFDSHESIRKPKVFWCFQWIQKKTMGRKGLRIGNIRNCDCFKWKCFNSNDYVRNVELVLMSRIEESEALIRSSKAVVRRCSIIKVFLETSQNSQENAGARDSFLIELFLQNTSSGCFWKLFCKIL